MARAALAAARARSAAAGRVRRTGDSAAAGAGARRLKRRRWSGPGADPARDPQPLSGLIAAFVAGSGSAAEVTRARLFTGWAEIVGTSVADHAEPVSLTDGELVVAAESTAWATQLRLMAPTIVSRVNKALGATVVVRLRTNGPTGPSWRFGNRHIPGRGPRDTYG